MPPIAKRLPRVGKVSESCAVRDNPPAPAAAGGGGSGIRATAGAPEWHAEPEVSSGWASVRPPGCRGGAGSAWAVSEQQYALLVDAGYLFACAGRLVLQTTSRREFRVETAGLV